jgi:hypothetical protein
MKAAVEHAARAERGGKIIFQFGRGRETPNESSRRESTSCHSQR